MYFNNIECYWQFLNSQNSLTRIKWEANNKLKFIIHFVLCVCLLASLNINRWFSTWYAKLIAHLRFFSSSPNFTLWTWFTILFFLLSSVFQQHGPPANRTRDSSVQTRYFTTRLGAHFQLRSESPRRFEQESWKFSYSQVSSLLFLSFYIVLRLDEEVIYLLRWKRYVKTKYDNRQSSLI